MREKRTKTWIHRFQTHLFFRIAFYFVLYQIAVWAFVYIEQTSYRSLELILGQLTAAYCFYFAAASVLSVGLLFIYDAVKFAHRIVGPLYRFRKTIQAITAGDELELVSLREGDFLQELKDEFNEMLKTLEQQGAIVLKTAKAAQNAKEHLPV